MESFEERWREPEKRELIRHAYLMASARLAFPLRSPASLSPVPCRLDDSVEEAARDVVASLVRTMNAVVAPVIATLERS